MSIKKKIVLTVLALFALAFLLLSLVLAVSGKAIISSQLQKLTGRKVQLGRVNLGLPLKVEIKNLVIEGMLKADKISASPSLRHFIFGKTAFNNVYVLNPEITYEKLPEPASASASGIPSLILPSNSEPPLSGPAQAAEKTKPSLSLILKHLEIENATIKFIDRSLPQGLIEITLKDLNLLLTELHIPPAPQDLKFELDASMPWKNQAEKGKVSAFGRVNLLKRDADAVVKLEGIDAVYLYPYYSNWVDLEKTHIQQARLNFISEIKGVNNNVTADCKIELIDIVRKPLEDPEKEEKAKIADLVFDIFKSLGQNKIVFNFTLRTKLDKIISQLLPK
ncbi:MAG: DUF748 domain-containing protein [Candidatus Omnitrophota bacterium]